MDKRGEIDKNVTLNCILQSLRNFPTVVLWKESIGRIRERKGVLWGESGREKASYGESQEEKGCPMGRVRKRKGAVWGEPGREKVS